MFEKLIDIVERSLVPVLAGIFMLRVGFLFANGLDLIGDESYYWDWSRRPDWCYYSKPPMVAWLMAVFTQLGGHQVAVVRLPTVVLGTVFLTYLFATAKAMYSPRAGALAVLLVLATPFNVLANFIMTIDPPLYCFWIMSLYYLQQALFGNQPKAWLWAGIATGAALLSKQVALFIPLMLVIFLWFNRLQQPLNKRHLTLYFVPIAFSLLPVLLWNQQHDWVMFGHSKGHFGIKTSVSVWSHLAQAAEFVGYQLLLLSPVLFVLVVLMTFQACFRFKSLNPKAQFLILMGPVLILGIVLLSLLQKVQGNWSMPFYLSGLILLSGQWLAGQWQKSLKVGVYVGFSMVLLTYALPLMLQLFNLQNTAIDPTARFRHWKNIAESVSLLRQQQRLDNENSLVITVGHRFLASQLAFYLPDQPWVYRYERPGKVVSQYEVWGWSTEMLGKNALIVSENDENKLPIALKSAFQSLQKLSSFPNSMQPGQAYHLFLGINLQAIPTLAEKPSAPIPAVPAQF